MKDSNLRKTIGERAKQRRKELKLGQDEVAKKMDVNASTIQRYEAGKIDNTKKLVLEGLASALHVSVEWLRGETDDYESDIEDPLDLQIQDKMNSIFNNLNLNIGKMEDQFSKELLLLVLCEYEKFSESFKYACDHYEVNDSYEQIAKTVGFSSAEEFNEVMFLREIMHSVNTFNEASDILRTYAKNPKVANNRLHALLNLFS